MSMILRIDFALIASSGWTMTNVGNTTGNKLTNIIDRDTGLATNIALDVITAFGGTTASGALTSANEYGVPELVWDRYATVNGSTTPSYVLYGSDLIVGHEYSVKFVGTSTAANTMRMVCNGVQADYANPGGAVPLSEASGTLAAPQTLTAVAVNDSTYGPALIFTVTNITNTAAMAHNWVEVTYLGAPAGGAAITNLDGGNTTAQYQVKTANVTGFTGTVSAGTLGGVALLSVVDNEDGTVDFRAPGTVSSGTRTLVLTDGTDSPELEVTHTQTHAYAAPTTVDTNSLFYGQAYETGSYFRIVTDFEHITLDAATVDLAGTWGDNLNDIALADPGYEGPDAITLEMLYVDGATAQWTVSVTVSAGGIIIVDSGSRKGIRNAIRSAIRNAISNSVKGA